MLEDETCEPELSGGRVQGQNAKHAKTKLNLTLPNFRVSMEKRCKRQTDESNCNALFSRIARSNRFLRRHMYGGENSLNAQPATDKKCGFWRAHQNSENEDPMQERAFRGLVRQASTDLRFSRRSRRTPEINGPQLPTNDGLGSRLDQIHE